MKTFFLIAVLVSGLLTAVQAANEITAMASLTVNKGYLGVSKQVTATWNLTNANPNVSGYTQLIGTNAAEVIGLGDVTAPGWAWFRNLGTNSHAITLGVVDSATNFLEFARLKSGEYGLIPVGTNAIYGLSVGTNETGTVLEKIILDR